MGQPARNASYVRLLASPRRMRRDIDPHLEDVASRDAIRVHRSPEDRLRRGRLADDHIRCFARPAGAQALPVDQPRRPQAIHIDGGI